MSRESDDNLSSINSAYTGKQNYFTYLHFIYIFTIILYYNLALQMRLTTHQKKKKESFTKFMANSYD